MEGNAQSGNRQFTTARAVSIKERRAYVVSLRKAGATYRQIAQAVIEEFGRDRLPKKYDERAACVDVKRELSRWQRGIHEDLRDYRWFQVQRYESIIRAHWAKAMSGLSLGYTDRVLKAMKDENALLGLNAPDRHDVRVLQIDARIDELMEAATRRRVEAVASRPQGEVAGALGSGREQAEDSIVEGTVRRL